MVRLSLCAVALAGAWFASAEESGKSLAVVENGKSDFVIRIESDAPLTDVFAAEELQLHLAKSTGATLPIVSNAADRVRAIEVGTRRALETVRRHYASALKEEESVYVIDADGVAIAGGGVRGSAYGVYSFLERELGCKWLTLAGDELVPRHETLRLKPRMHREKPALDYRDILCMGLHWKADDSDNLFLYRNRLNQGANDFRKCNRRDLEGKMKPRIIGLSPGCHSFYHYIPPYDTKTRKGYFKDHPEYFTMDKKGKRVVSQLCFSCRGLREEMTKNIIENARKQGGKGFVDLSMQDDQTDDFCYCPDCLKLKEKYGSVGGPFYDFVLEMGPRVKKELPELVLHFLAYRVSQTQRAPQIPVAWPDNVVAVFAPIDNDFSKPFDHPNNARAYADFKSWSRLTRTWAWYYPLPYAPGRPPFGGLERTARDTRLMMEAGLDGAFYEHDVGTDQGLNFADLQTWMLLQHFRDPKRDWRELRREFCEAYYGAVADDMIAYSDDLEDLTRKHHAFAEWHLPLKGVYTPKRLAKWNRLFDRMERRVGGDPVFVQRIREARLGLEYVTMTDYRKVVKEHPGVLPPASNMYARSLSTLRQAVDRRYDYPPSAETLRKKRFNQYETYLSLAHVMAGVEPKPLPKEFDGIPKDRIRQVLPERPRAHTRRIKMEDAATDYALYETGVTNKFPFRVKFRQPRPIRDLATLAIEQKDVEPGVFKFYKIGRAPMPTEDCRLILGHTEWFWIPCEKMYIPGNDDLWDVWVSLKFDGPQYDPSSTASESRVLFDRAVFVGPYPKN